MKQLFLPRVTDFTVTGDGSNPAWDSTAWETITRVGGERAYATRAKSVYSTTGIYFLVDCEDLQLTCSLTEDFADLYVEDVVEVFLWPDEKTPNYFEYEISPLNVELPIIVTNNEGVFHGWLPWHFTGERKTRKAATVTGGEQASMASVTGWCVEFFIPFALLTGLGNVPPTPGMTWRGNIYRIDYDASPTHWAWDPDTKTNFHDYEHFGELVFGE